jgi:hypothetical protein
MRNDSALAEKRRLPTANVPLIMSPNATNGTA